MNTINIATLETLTGSQLVAFFNEHKDADVAPVKRFADKKAALKRCLPLAERLVEAQREAEAARAEAEAARAELIEASVNADDRTHELRSTSIAATWKNPEIKARRLNREKVLVDGVEFSSIPAAFRELGFKWSNMIKFRLLVKAEGAAVYTHEGKDYKFAIIRND